MQKFDPVRRGHRPLCNWSWTGTSRSNLIESAHPNRRGCQMRSREPAPKGSIQHECECFIELLRKHIPPVPNASAYRNLFEDIRQIAESDQERAKNLLENLREILRREKVFSGEQWEKYMEE